MDNDCLPLLDPRENLEGSTIDEDTESFTSQLSGISAPIISGNMKTIDQKKHDGLQLDKKYSLPRTSYSYRNSKLLTALSPASMLVEPGLSLGLHCLPRQS